jgi:hypothetical protein
MAAFTETWFKLVDTLMKTFVFLRDVFGYFIPGACLLGLVYYGRLTWILHDKAINTYQILAVLVAAYGLGQVLVALGYRSMDIAKFFASLWFEGGTPNQVAIEKERKKTPNDCDETIKARLRQRETSGLADQLFGRAQFPPLFIERDRQDTIHITRIGVAVALIAAGVMHLYQLGPVHVEKLTLAHQQAALLIWRVSILVGLVILYNSYRGQEHHGILTDAAIEAAKRAADAKMNAPGALIQATPPPAPPPSGNGAGGHVETKPPVAEQADGHA